METAVTTRAFVIDRKAYIKVRLALILRRLGPTYLVVLVAGLVGSTLVESNTFRAAIYAALGILALLIIAVVQITVSRINSARLRHVMDASRTFEFSDVDIKMAVEGVGESTVNWTMFSGIQRLGEWTFILQDVTPAIAVPDSAFASSADLQAFRELVDRKRLELKRQAK